MKEYELDKVTLMGGWFIPKKVCDNLTKFMDNQALVDGKMYSSKGSQEVIKDLKELPKTANANIKNALFVGSTTELQKMLKKDEIIEGKADTSKEDNISDK